ncbi:MAG: helix-turn-helix transcriptional regulator [Candidatus Pacebacteria bacterium]|nr:helix-turn-helix transcriptional regulator [Candidatus Paceibacterota bacterium]
MKTKSFKSFKKELLKDKQVKSHYDEIGFEFELVRLLIEKRIKKGLTQKDIAEKIGTKQSAIARLESGKYNPSLSFLNKVARALGAKIKIDVS